MPSTITKVYFFHLTVQSKLRSSDTADRNGNHWHVGCTTDYTLNAPTVPDVVTCLLYHASLNFIGIKLSTINMFRIFLCDLILRNHLIR